MVFGVLDRGEDKEFAKDFRVKTEVKYATRIGNKKIDEVRRIKVATGASHQQDRKIQTWSILKEIHDAVESVSLETLHYTRGDKSRSGLKAKKHRDDSGFVWRVRGSPYKRLYLKRIMEKRERERCFRRNPPLPKNPTM